MSTNGEYVTYKFVITSGLSLLALVCMLFGTTMGYAIYIRKDVDEKLKYHEAEPHRGAVSKDEFKYVTDRLYSKMDKMSDKMDRILDRVNGYAQ